MSFIKETYNCLKEFFGVLMVKFDYVDFSGEILYAKDFSNIMITNCIFDKCDLRGVRFNNCILSNCSFVGAFFGNTDFRHSKLENCNFSKCHNYINIRW